MQSMGWPFCSGAIPIVISIAAVFDKKENQIYPCLTFAVTDKHVATDEKKKSSFVSMTTSKILWI